MITRNLCFYCRLFFFFSLPLTVCSQTGSIHEPVRYIGGNSIDPDLHEGRLRYAIGVDSRQTLRVNRTHPQKADDHGWTYNHASNLAYWKGTFYQQYLSNPVDEHIAPGQTLMIIPKMAGNGQSRKLFSHPMFRLLVSKFLKGMMAI